MRWSCCFPLTMDMRNPHRNHKGPSSDDQEIDGQTEQVAERAVANLVIMAA